MNERPGYPSETIGAVNERAEGRYGDGIAPSFGSLCDQAQGGVFEVDFQGRLVYANNALARVYGFASPEAMMAGVPTVWSLYVEPGRHEELLQRIKELGAVAGFKSRARRRDGRIIWVSEQAAALKDESGGLLGYFGTVCDVTMEVLAERAVFEAKDTWSSLGDHGSECLLVVKRSGAAVFVSTRAKDVLGVDVDELLSKVVLPEARTKLEGAIANVSEWGHAELIELPVDLPDARTRWLEFRLMPLWRDEAARETVVVATDVTLRRQAEEELQASRRFAERIADTLPAVLYVLDLKRKRFTYVNDQVEKILGYKKDEWLAMEWPEYVGMVHTDDVALLEERMRQLTAAGEKNVFESDYRLRHRSNGWRTVRVRETAFGEREGERRGEILGMVYDITDQVGMRGAIRRSEEQFRSLLECTQAVPWEYDLDAEIFTYVGPQAERMLGFPLERWYEPGFWISRVHPEDVETARLSRSRSLDVPADGYQCEYRLRAADGNTVWVQDTVHLDVSRGDPGRLRGFALDITKLRRSQNERETANQQLRALSERLADAREEERAHLAREFHDQLGQELTGMKMDLKWIAVRTSKTGNDPEVEGVKERTEDMLECIDRMIQTVRSIATSLRPAVLDECGLAMAIEWQATEFERRSGIRCSVVNRWTREFEDPALSTALFRIFQEILTNVARHSGADRVNVLLKSSRQFDFMEVTDNGRGITPSEISNSLGILGMRERASAFGAKLEIRGVPEKGTTVCVRLKREFGTSRDAQKPSGNPLWWLIPSRDES